MKSKEFESNRISLTKKQKCMVAEMQGSDERWLTVCNENEDGEKDLSKTINLSYPEVQMLQNTCEAILEVIEREEADELYSMSKYMKVDQNLSWDSRKKMKCFVLKSTTTEELLNDDVYKTEDEASRALRFLYYDKEAHPDPYEVTTITMMQPERCAVVEHVLRSEIEKLPGTDKDIKGIDKALLAAVIARTLKELDFTVPLNAAELLDAFLYFGGFDKILCASEKSQDIHDRQQFNLIKSAYNYACSYMNFQ
jgi:hypothetical protein